MPAAVKSRECTIVKVERQLAAAVKNRVPMNEIPNAERAAREKLRVALPTLEVGQLGRSFTLWRPPVDGRLYLEAGVIVARAFEPAGDVVPSSLPAGRAAHFLLVGSYDELPGAWDTLLGWCNAQKLKLAGANWQVYENESDDSSNAKTSLFALLA